MIPQERPETSEADDAARWRYVRDHALLCTGEDDDLGLFLFLAGEDWRETQTYLTRKQRRQLEGREPDGTGVIESAATITAAIDHKRAPTPEAGQG